MIAKARLVRQAKAKKRPQKKAFLRRPLVLESRKASTRAAPEKLFVPAGQGSAHMSPLLYLPSGPFADVHGLRPQHHIQAEHEQDHEAPDTPFPALDYQLSEE
jgi:hypothetical protein